MSNRSSNLAHVAAFAVLAAAGAIACKSSGQRTDTRPLSDTAATAGGNGQTMEDLFAGKFPGVMVSRAPNGGISIRIRGSGTINGSEEPLYVVDGMTVPQGSGGIFFLNPNDIARIEVLKSAGEIAEYGVQGANGVVRITTKKGR
jgi:TonB-dependent SusC/RagA subfamily outer membrane receptor